jgi:VIT1/CCC1 family predicted Fe2+/Mn2+ transporter
MAKLSQVLDPTDRLGETLFGLIMVLSFTCSISVATAGRQEVREMLIAALGCNTAWGIVDGAMYALSRVLERTRQGALLRSLRAAPDADAARALLAGQLEPDLQPLLESGGVDAVLAHVRRLPERTLRRPGIEVDDLRGALAVFALIFLTTFPVTLPFVFLHEPVAALRVSNGVALVMMFLTGVAWARAAGASQVRAGLLVVALGVVLLGVTLALGG